MRTREDDAGFEDLVHRQSRFVFRVAYAMLRHSHDAEDVVQETFLKLYRSGAWRQMKDERAFLARVAWREAVDRVRATRISEQPSDNNRTLLEVASTDAGPEDIVLAADSQALVHRLIDGLPEELRQPLALSAFQELNSRQIAEILGAPEGTVRTRLMRARQVLKQKLAAHLERRYAE